MLYLPPDGPELQEVRLTCSILSDIAASRMFYTVRTPRNAEAFRRAVDVLCQENIAHRIRELNLHNEFFVSRTYLYHAECGHTERHRLILDFCADEGRAPDLVTEFAICFPVQLFRLLACCNNRLRCIRLGGLN